MMQSAAQRLHCGAPVDAVLRLDSAAHLISQHVAVLYCYCFIDPHGLETSEDQAPESPGKAQAGGRQLAGTLQRQQHAVARYTVQDMINGQLTAALNTVPGSIERLFLMHPV